MAVAALARQHQRPPVEPAGVTLRYDRAVDVSTGSLLAALVVACRPDLVIETGTYPGRSTNALAAGVRLAGRGRIETYERQAGLAVEMQAVFAGQPDVIVFRGAPTSFAAAGLAVIDSGPTYADRADDLECWTETATPGSLLVVDDTNEPWFDPWGAKLGVGVMFADGHGVGVWRR